MASEQRLEKLNKHIIEHSIYKSSSDLCCTDKINYINKSFKSFKAVFGLSIEPLKSIIITRMVDYMYARVE